MSDETPMPSGWCEVQLEDLVLNPKSDLVDGPFGSNLKSSEYVESGIPVLKIQNIKANRFVRKRLSYVTPKKAAELSRHSFVAGDLMITKLGEPLGLCCEVPADLEHGVFVADLMRLRPSAKIVDSAFLLHAINSVVVQGQFKEITKGTTRQRVNLSIVRGIKLALPPLAEQQRIMGKVEELFSELDEGVANLKQARAQLVVYRQALLKHAFEGHLTADWRTKHASELESADQLLARIRAERDADCDSISEEESKALPVLPSGWTHARFGEFIQSMSAGKSFSCEERRPRPEEIGVAKVSAVTWGEYQEAESKTCVDATKINPAYFIQEGDFLLSRANTIDLVGASVIVKRVTQRIMLSDKTLRLSIKGIPPEYLLYYLRSRQGRREIMARSTGNQESMRNIGQDRIRSIIVPVCSPAEAAKIVELLETHLPAIVAEEADIDLNLQKAEALRQSILKKAFAGELVPQDPADEPAAALLARIRAEREAATARPKAKQAGKRPAKLT